MALTDPYLTAAEFRLRAKIDDDAQDAAIESVLKAASRQIDGFCGRTFAKTDDPEARVFSASPWNPRTGYGSVGSSIAVDEFVSIDAIATDDGDYSYGVTVDPEDYSVLPSNAAALGEPYTAIDRLDTLGWPTHRDGVRVTAVWGWPAPPAVVVEVCFMLANRMKSIWTAPFGISGSGELSSLQMSSALSPLFKEMLAPYRVLTV